MSLDCFGRFLNQKITTGKKVQLSGHWLQCRIVLASLSLYYLAGSSIKLQIMTGKKGTVVLDGQTTVPFFLGRNLINEGRNPPKNIAHNFHFSKYEIW